MNESIHHLFQITLHDMDPIAHAVTEQLGDLIQYFRYSPNSYYGDNLFFISIVLHKIPQFKNIAQVILLDSDLKFKADILDLHGLFRQFSPTEIIGIAREGQPVYRHIFSTYRYSFGNIYTNHTVTYNMQFESSPKIIEM